jgi:hypothetical protein
MKKKFKLYLMGLFAVGSLFANERSEILNNNDSSINNFAPVETVQTLKLLHNSSPPQDGDIMYVEGYRNRNDGGGGFFVFDANSTLEPVYDNMSAFRAGNHESDVLPNSLYNGQWDGMVVKPRYNSFTNGRWIRRWDRGKLNIRWFGGTPGNSYDCSISLNTALSYAQKPLDNSDIFSNKAYTSPGKTIFFPSGKYYFKSAIADITYGVVIEGEGNMGLSDHGTHFWMLLDYIETNPNIPSANQSGFFRFLSNDSHSSGGGFKNLLISVDNPYYTADPNDVETVYTHQNVITLRALDNTIVAGSAPAISKWTAENVVINCRGNALRAMYMRSYVTEGLLPYRIRDISLINCWFGGNSEYGESVHAQNVSGLHIVSGFFSSGRGNGNDPSMPGIFLGGTEGCFNTHLDGVDLTHAIIKIHQKSAFVNIDCRFGRLEILYKADINTDSTSMSNLGHHGLQVTKQHILNPRRLPYSENPASPGVFDIPNRLKCPEPGDIGYDSKYTPDDWYWKCYNYTNQIEMDPDWD